MLGEAANPEPTRLHTFSLILVYSQTIQHNRNEDHVQGLGRRGLRAQLKSVCMATCLENTGELRMHWSGTAQILMLIVRP